MKYFVPIILSSLLSACSVYSPDAGHEVVLVEKPWFFGHGGVDPDPVKPGRTFAAFSTEGVDVYMQPMKAEIEMHDTMTSDGVPISFHAIMVLQVTDSVSLIKTFGRDWYRNNLEEQFKTMVRQAVRKRGMNETAISTTALDAIDEEIRQALVAFIKEKGLPLKAHHNDCGARQSAGCHQEPAHRDGNAGATHSDRAADQTRRDSA